MCSIAEFLSQADLNDDMIPTINGFFKHVLKHKYGLQYKNMKGSKYRLLKEPGVSRYKTITLHNTSMPSFSWELHLERNFLPYMVKSYGPVPAMVAIAWLGFLIPPEMVPGRAGILVTLFLVMANLYIYEMESLPYIGSITPLHIWYEIGQDLLFLAFLEYAYLLFLMRFGNSNSVESVIGNNDRGTMEGLPTNPNLKLIKGQNFKEKAKRIDSFAIKVFPLISLAILSLYFCYYLIIV